MADFRAMLRVYEAEFGADRLDLIDRFRELVLDESQRQNLSRLLDPQEFFDGHVVDCVELGKSGLLEYPAMDLGSGVGVPGIISAILWGGNWVLAESECKKAEFLSRTLAKLHLGNVSVHPGRAESFLKSRRVSSIVARAVGPVERIYGWIRPCSTWNNLLLLKGPGWPDEWESFSKKRELILSGSHEYSVGSDKKYRRIVRLSRTHVPRGTS